MPVYAHGLSQVLEHNGMAVTDIWESHRDLVSHWTADVAVVALSVARDATADPTQLPRHLLLGDELPNRHALLLEEHVGGYVLRTASVSTVVSAVRTVAQGGYFWKDQAPTKLADTLPTQRSNPLSSREHQVLELIASGFTQAQIATRLGISRHTVDTYIRRIRSKWALGNKAELTRAALLTARP